MKTILRWRQMNDDERYTYACDVDDNIVVFVRHDGTFELHKTLNSGLVFTFAFLKIDRVFKQLKRYGYDI